MSRHESNPTRLLGRLIASYPGIIPAIGPACGGWIVLSCCAVFIAHQSFGLRGGWTAAVVMMVVASTALLWRQTARGVDLYQHGLEYHHGRWRRRVYWNQVCELYQTSLHPLGFFFPTVGRSTWRYRLVCRDGSRLRLQNLEGIHDLGQRIDQQVTSRHLPLALDAYRAGYTLRFGRHLSLNSEGIYIRLQFIPWHEVAEIAIGDQHQLTIGCVGDRRRMVRLACIRIANLRVLDGILQAVRTGEIDDTSEIDIYRNLSSFQDSFISYADPPVDGNDTLLELHDDPEFNSLDFDLVTLDNLLRHLPQHRPRQPR